MSEEIIENIVETEEITPTAGVEQTSEELRTGVYMTEESESFDAMLRNAFGL